MRLGSLALPLVACAVASCSAAKAEAPDPTNPFHCGVAFSVYHGIAKSTGNSGTAMFERRMRIEGAKAAVLPAAQRTRAEGEALMRRLLADPDEAYETAIACAKRQDAERRSR